MNLKKITTLNKPTYLMLSERFILNHYDSNLKLCFSTKEKIEVFLSLNPAYSKQIFNVNELNEGVIIINIHFKNEFEEVINNDKFEIYLYNDVDLKVLNNLNELPVEYVNKERYLEAQNHLDKNSQAGYVIGEPSSGTLYLSKIIEEIYCLQNNSLIQKYIYDKFKNMNLILEDTITFNNSVKLDASEFKTDEVIPLIKYGWTHDNPESFLKAFKKSNIKKIYVHRDCRDIVVSYIKEISKMRITDDNGSIEHFPKYYDCLVEDMKFSFLNLFQIINRWNTSVLAFYLNKEHFLEIRFSDFTIENINDKKIKTLVNQIIEYYGVNITSESIVTKITKLTHTSKNTLCIRKSSKKIGIYENFFEQKEMLAIENFCSLGLSLLNYSDVFRKQLDMNKNYIAVIDKNEYELSQKFIFLLVHKYNVKIENTIDINEFNEKNNSNKQYLIFSRYKVDSNNQNITYFPYYKFFIEYEPYVYILNQKNKRLLEDIKGESLIVIYSNLILFQSLIHPVFTNKFNDIKFIHIDKFKMNNITNEFIINCINTVSENYELSKQIYSEIADKDRFASLYPFYLIKETTEEKISI